MDASIGQACEGQARAFKDQVMILIIINNLTINTFITIIGIW